MSMLDNARALAAMERTPGSLGAIDAALTHLNWTELLAARASFAALIEAAREALPECEGTAAYEPLGTALANVGSERPEGVRPQGAITLADLDAAFEAEIQRVSHMEYDSNEICRHFFGELRKRLAAATAATDTTTKGEPQ